MVGQSVVADLPRQVRPMGFIFSISPSSILPPYSRRLCEPSTNARLMSKSGADSGSTSPNDPVRSSEASSANSHGSNTTSSSQPKEITPIRVHQYNGLQFSRQTSSDVGQSLGSSQSPENHVRVHNNDTSDPNTPRLPPTRHGASDHESIPHEATMLLNTIDRRLEHPQHSTESIKHDFLSAQTPSRTFPSSISEPGARNGENHELQAEKSRGTNMIASWLEKSANPTPDTAKPTAHHIRTSSDISSPPRVSNTWEPATRYTPMGNTGERSARQEAFSEKRNRSSSRSSQSRVEKRIEATLADAEPSTHARSRKSSHTFGLFKETTTSQGSRRSQENSRTPSDYAIDASRDSKKPSDLDVEKQKQRSQFRKSETREIESSRSAEIRPQSHHERKVGESELEISQRVREPSGNGSKADFDAETPSEVQKEADNTQGTGRLQGAHKPSEISKQRVPKRLLEEIRNFHNLAAPVHDKFRSSQPKPTSYGQDTDDTIESSLLQEAAVTERDSADEDTEAIATLENEEEESEHISSALYYPHQAPSPDALEDVSIDDARKVKEASLDSGTPFPKPALSSPEEDSRSEDVDIALQLHNQNRYLHGDLSKVQPPSAVDVESRQNVDSGGSSASESDYDSFDENERPSVLEESSFTDDGELTPRASPKTRKSHLSSRSQKVHRAPAAPLGAVELKPFNHQVGGHTNLFRFSKRAVCKQLSNRENEFYEVVERLHPELLKFLPKYVDNA